VLVLTVPAQNLRVVLDTATEKGAPAADICAAVGLDPRLLDDANARVLLEVASDTYDESARRTGDDAFGLHVAERSDYFAFDALGLAVSAKQNLKDAIEHLGPAITALHGTRMELEVIGDQARLAISMPEESIRPCRHRTEAYMARVVRMIELATGARPLLRRVAFRYEKPASVAEHERVFASPIVFGAPRNEIAMDRSILEAPLVRADAHLSHVLDQHVKDLAARMPAVQAIADQVRRYVRDAFPRGDSSIESIGKRMGMGARTLQRWLRDEGTSHRQIVEQVRHELALRYLVETRMPIKEVAVFLGYSELRAFYRAFERWTGLAPAAYRKNTMSGRLNDPD
jgi:AraC-like DNA-binding protein